MTVISRTTYPASQSVPTGFLPLPDGRDARALRTGDLWRALKQVLPDLDPTMGKHGLLAAYEAYLLARDPSLAPGAPPAGSKANRQ